MASSQAIAAVGRRLRGTTMMAAMRIVTSMMRSATAHHVASNVILTTSSSVRALTAWVKRSGNEAGARR